MYNLYCLIVIYGNFSNPLIILTLQADLLDATPASFGSQPASVHGSSSVEPVSSDFSLGRAGTIAPFARCTRPRPPLDQPTLNQLAFFWDDQ
jgi:hypothetical protein